MLKRGLVFNESEKLQIIRVWLAMLRAGEFGPNAAIWAEGRLFLRRELQGHRELIGWPKAAEMARQYEERALLRYAGEPPIVPEIVGNGAGKPQAKPSASERGVDTRKLTAGRKTAKWG